MKKGFRIAILVVIVLAAVAYVSLLPPIPQDPVYHRFADHRPFLRVTNFLDVASNAPFLFVGVWGLLVVFRRRTLFLVDSERWPYAIFFLGMALTSVGSGYYHLHPDNARLVWDRLPMTLGFMGILSAVLMERISRKTGLILLPLLVAAGAGSVLYWHVTESLGRGDLRLYVLVQFGSLLSLLTTLLLFRSEYTQQTWIFIALALYVAAKYFEVCDAYLFARLRIVSGHTLKHLAAAVAAASIAYMLRSRRFLNRNMPHDPLLLTPLVSECAGQRAR